MLYAHKVFQSLRLDSHKPIRLMSVPQIGSYVLGKAAGRESLIQANPNAQMYACIFNEHSYTSEHF